ncbi:MAG: GIY-YIG nuclease family protein [Firmicutes bacterium]|nr:GIY-YIG nuclease family protein [Bacillota bacterium]
MWYAYAILCDDGSIYKGHTDNIERRYKEHSDGLGAKHTKNTSRLIYVKEFSTQSEALIHEKYLKTGNGREMLKAECAMD